MIVQPHDRWLKMFTFAAFGALVALGACKSERVAPLEMSAEEGVLDDGRAIAEAQCSACHAIGRYGESPDPAAPPFRVILSRYHANVLDEELIAGVRVAHPMPEFQFNPKGADALTDYLKSIQQVPLSQ